ncbi:MAG: DUF362 domain-containing protein [Clostridia bacterium]|nr:DUF362 domain-containing protein [Clostridia bacterium]
MENKVAVIGCATYDQTEVDAAVKRAFDLLGGLESAIRPGMRVALKVNLLRKNKPEDAVTTHPAVVAAVAKQVRALGATPVIGDSPAGPFTLHAVEEIYKISGMVEAAAQSGAELNKDMETVDDFFAEAKKINRLTVCRYLKQADVIIDLAKLKTHGLTAYTGAVKNLFGTVPGTAKVEYHFRLPEVMDFSDMLVDLNEYFKPVFCLIDGVVGMEGEGPSNGEVRQIGCLIASKSTYAADLVGMKLMDLAPERVATAVRAYARGLAPISADELTLVGDDVAQFVMPDFKVPVPKTTKILPRFAPQFVLNGLMRILRPKPRFNKKICVGCGICVRSCPPKALKMVNRRPEVDLDVCIRCFCCQELCPHDAVVIKRSKILQRIG